MIVLGDFASAKNNIDLLGINKKSNLLINCEGFLTENNYSALSIKML